ncbi:MAG: O-antigen ligase family protein [Patescibacteria group bacterium]|nr:O-antigen ligase family protein [Patescibacteria group bacterium]
MNNRQGAIKNIVILLTELTVIFLMLFNVLPREAGIFLTGLLVFYFIFSPLEDSLWVFTASIPLFVALPITENFDHMANWRILLIVLFFVLFFRHGISISLFKNTSGKWKLREKLRHELFEYLTGIFLVIGALSLFVADDIWAGAKKIIFLVNILLLFLIIRNLSISNKNIIPKLINALKIAIGITLGIGFIQLIAIFFIPLYTFWQFWARQVIPVFYGQDLGNLLSYSNTWFSYYAEQPPTLRMFSVFPDSHSFAFFCILAIPFFLTVIFLRQRKNREKLFLNYFLLIICLTAIVFSGSRGAWVSALGALTIFLFSILLFYSPTIRSKTNFFVPENISEWKKKIQLILGCLIIFFLLFPISSGILLLAQKAQMGKELRIEKISLFERTKSIADFAETSAKGRLDIWQRTADSIMMRPVLGVGIGNYPFVINEEISSAKRGASAHNFYLDVAAEMGIFALLVLLVIFWQIFKKSWRVFQDKTCLNNPYLQSWASFFVLALVWILGYSLFDVVLLNDKVFLFFITNLGLLYASVSFNKSSNI